MTHALAAVGGPQPSTDLLAAILPLLILALAVDVYCLVDLVRAESVRYLPRPVWALIIVFISFPFGALLYLFVGRDRNRGRKVRSQ